MVEWVGNGPSNYNAVGGTAINDAGMIAGAASLRSTSLNIVSVFRYEGAAGWRFIAGSSKYTVASGINALGDVAYGELGAGVYLEGSGTFAVNDLLSAATLQAGWSVTGNGGKINDQRASQRWAATPSPASPEACCSPRSARRRRRRPR